MSKPELNAGHGGTVIAPRDRACFWCRETTGDMRLWPGMRAWFPELAQEALAEQATRLDPLAPMSLEEWRK